MNPNDDIINEDNKMCPHCRRTFSSLSARNKHQRNVCEAGSMTPVSTRKSRPPEVPAVLLKEDHEGLLLGHTCFFSIYRICELLKLTNSEVYPPLSSCTISGGVNVCPTTDTDRVRLKVLLAAKHHGIDQISVPKKG